MQRSCFPQPVRWFAELGRKDVYWMSTGCLLSLLYRLIKQGGSFSTRQGLIGSKQGRL